MDFELIWFHLICDLSVEFADVWNLIFWACTFSKTTLRSSFTISSGCLISLFIKQFKWIIFPNIIIRFLKLKHLYLLLRLILINCFLVLRRLIICRLLFNLILSNIWCAAIQLILNFRWLWGRNWHYINWNIRFEFSIDTLGTSVVFNCLLLITFNNRPIHQCLHPIVSILNLHHCIWIIKELMWWVRFQLFL